jgi:hypothetical protein
VVAVDLLGALQRVIENILGRCIHNESKRFHDPAGGPNIEPERWERIRSMGIES